MDNEPYIPPYQPDKYRTAIKVCRAISLGSLLIMIFGAVAVVAIATLDPNSFIVNVQSVPQKDISGIIILVGCILSVFGLTSLFVHVLGMNLRAANAIFSEPDESKRAKAVLTPVAYSNWERKHRS